MLTLQLKCLHIVEFTFIQRRARAPVIDPTLSCNAAETPNQCLVQCPKSSLRKYLSLYFPPSNIFASKNVLLYISKETGFVLYVSRLLRSRECRAMVTKNDVNFCKLYLLTQMEGQHFLWLFKISSI